LSVFVTDTLQLAAAEQERNMNKDSDTDAQNEQSFLSALLQQLNMTLEQIGSLGSSDVEAGELWAADLDAAGMPGPARRVGQTTDLSWPVANDDVYFALQSGRLVDASASEPAPVGDATVRWLKLLGVTEDGTLLGIVHDSDNGIRAATLASDGSLSVDGAADTTGSQIGFLMQESRSYAQNRAVFVERAENGRGFDVYFKLGDKRYNVSDCGDDSCGQPTLSSDLRRIVYIRQPRY
jgi:hypothetical protein